MNIDLRTAVILSALVSAAMSIMLIAAHRSFPRSIGGLGHWGMGSLGFGIAASLASARGQIPQLLSVILANFIMLLSLALWWQGTRVLLGEKDVSWRRLGAGLALVMAGLMYWTYAEPNFTARTILITALGSVAYALQISLVSRHWHRAPAEVFFVGIMGVGLFSTLARALGAVLSPTPQDDLFAPSVAQSVYLVAFNFLSLLHAVAFFLLAMSYLAKRLADMARIDPLTGALNRRALADSMRLLIAVAQRKRQFIAAVVCDLDHFKRINDQHGHDAGDEVLRHFTQLVLEQKRSQDLFARLGGEEFALLLLDTTESQALEIACRLHKCLNAERNDTVPAYTASWGVAAVQLSDEEALPADGITQQLLIAADRAAYRAKKLGRNQVIAASSDPAVAC